MASKALDQGQAWRAIAGLDAESISCTGEMLAALPAPARRFLERAVPTGERSLGAVELVMEGKIKLKRWFPFTARQILHPTGGFVWEASVGWWWLRFRGGDMYWRGRGSLDFRLAGRLPVARGSGADVDRSAAGRLAIETAVWAPQALLPSAGASWRPIDAATASVSRLLDGKDYEVTIGVDDDGTLRDVQTQRWGNPDGGEFGLHPFGGSVLETDTVNGLTIATAGTAGWWWGTERQAEGEFFRYRIVDTHPV